MIVSIGLDIAKEKIDVSSSENEFAVIDNTKSAIKNYFNQFERTAHIVMEATGKFHRLAHRTLEEMGFQVMVVNPYQTRHFAKSLNLLCKTDKVDAKMLRKFGEKMDFKPTPCATEVEQTMQDLSKGLDDLKQTKQDLESRAKNDEGYMASIFKELIQSIEEKIKYVENKQRSLIKANETLTQKQALLLTVPGIGEATAISLLSYMRELGTLTKREISALSGLAPINNDSGTFRGVRRIRGGRHDVRLRLYMPTLGAATQHNKRLNSFYERLVSNGKPKKVAITACMRKLLVWANAVVASGEPWNENYA